ncbi:ArsR family transcriptional regulator (plasmid) [Hymenobacter oligotrophus]|uniref:ArsR family transcriptional regulator n=1 Tax=Hymenobacter oligotrophus TaxID=2319843 RepID=A0A3B7RF23_9BACT|nr:ArsR family transcriptional regulator [Hymenobacter oligotrophus]
MMNTTCIRVYADGDYLQQCQGRLADVDSSLQIMATVLALTGNEVRLRILYLLATEQQLCVCDIADILRMTVSAVSQHLRKLKDGDVLQARKVGQTVFYALSPTHAPVVQPLLAGLIASSTSAPTL